MALTKGRTAFNHSTTAIEPSVVIRNPPFGNSGLRADLPIWGIEGHPTASTFSVDTQLCCGKADRLRFQQKYRKREVFAQHGFCELPLPLYLTGLEYFRFYLH